MFFILFKQLNNYIIDMYTDMYIKGVIMGKYSVPEEIRKHKPKGSVVKLVKNGYYVYGQTNIKDPVTNKWKIKAGKYLGKITFNDGFIPVESSYISQDDDVYEFGQYAISYLLGYEIKKKLSEFFDLETASRIYINSLIHLVNGFTYIYKLPILYENSFFYLYNTYCYKETSIVNLYESLGRKRQAPENFEASLLKECNKLIIDGHCIASSSLFNDLAKKGNKANKFNSEQINLIMGYDADKGRPVFSRIVSGDQLDKTSIEDIINTKNLKNILYIIDKGFYNNDNLKLFTSNGCHYIIPIQENTNDYKELISKANYTKDYFVYKANSKKTVIYYSKVISSSNRYLYAFRDLTVHALECDDYLEKIELGKIIVSEEERQKTMNNFGTLYLMSDKEFEPKEIFTNYKKRWNIETYYNYIKNHLEFDSTHLQDYYIAQGLSFIVLVSSYIYYIIKDKIKETPYRTVDELLLDMRSIKLRKDNNVWHTTSTTNKRKKIFDDLNLDLTSLIKQVNDGIKLQAKNHEE